MEDPLEQQWAAAPEALVEVEMLTEEAQNLVEILDGLGACSSSVRPAQRADADGGTEQVLREAPGDATPLWRRCVVTALFDARLDLSGLAQAVQAALDLPVPPEMSSRPVEDRDWISHVQQKWDPLPLGGGFEVLLPWHEGPGGGELTAQGDRVVLRMEGGAAFGLGDHPTTQGAASFVERAVASRIGSAGAGSCKILDYGTGSGVLAICGALLGASVAAGVDVDAPSVAVARRNAELNAARSGAAMDFRVAPADFDVAEAFARELAEALGPFDVVVGNILRRPLVALAPALAAAAAPGARLGLTGLRAELGDFTAIAEAYGEDFEELREVPLAGGWILVEGRRRP